MAVPKFDDLMDPALQALHELGGSASIGELEEVVAKNLDLSEEEINEIHRGSVTKLSYRLAWARNYLKNYGLIENSARGVWALTPDGSKIKSIDKEEVKRKIYTLYKNKAPRQEDSVSEDSEDIAELTWKEELLELIKSLSPSSFENLCKRLLRESGFTNVEVTGKSGDGGIDGKGVVKIGGLLSFHVVFQAKRYKDTVSPSVIRDFRGAMVGRADKGLVITTGTFTRDARAEAQRDGATPIDLVDGEDLAERLKNLSIGIKTIEEIIEKVQIDKNWFLSI
jgi:restriction system protein